MGLTVIGLLGRPTPRTLTPGRRGLDNARHAYISWRTGHRQSQQRKGTWSICYTGASAYLFGAEGLPSASKRAMIVRARRGVHNATRGKPRAGPHQDRELQIGAHQRHQACQTKKGTPPGPGTPNRGAPWPPRVQKDPTGHPITTRPTNRDRCNQSNPWHKGQPMQPVQPPNKIPPSPPEPGGYRPVRTRI